MKNNLELDKPQKFVVVETEKGVLLRSDSSVKFHKDIVEKMKNEGVEIISIKGGAKIKIEDKNIYVWDKSGVYGEVSFPEVLEILNKDFPGREVLNYEPAV
ncbi:MAG: hypothetical protein V4509_01215 [Patescibacteria group bacterium]